MQLSLLGLAVRPWTGFVTWLRQLSSVFGLKFLTFIFFGEHILKGFLDGGGSDGSGFVIIENMAYMQLQVGASTKIILLALSGASWSLKPIFGMLSDALVVFGYRRLPWIVLTAVLATAAYSTIFILGQTISAYLLCFCFFLIRTQTAWTDLMVEAAYTERMQRHPEHSADIVSFVWSGIGIATVAGVLVVGPGLDVVGPFAMAGLAAPLAGAIVVPAALGWLGEARSTNPSCGVKRELLRRHRPLLACAAALSAVVVASSVCALLGLSIAAQAAVAAGGATIVAGLSVWLLPAGFWKPMLFMFLASALSVNTYGFVENFYLDAPSAEASSASGYPVCLTCPHFSNTFYVTTVGVCDSLFMLVGSWLFNDALSGCTYRQAICFTTVLWSAATLLDLVQFQRWNVHYGVPDEAYIILKRAVQGTCSMLVFLPTTILISKLCPEEAESIGFSVLAGFSNFGLTLSAFFGAYALEWIGMDRIGCGAEDDFSNAWKACLINALSPLLALLFVPFLVPDAHISDLLAVQSLNGEYEAVVPDDVLDRVLVLPEEAGGGSALVDSADLANTRTSVDFETVHVGSTPAVQR